MSEADWRAVQETLYLESIPGMKKSIVKGLKTPVKTMSSIWSVPIPEGLTSSIDLRI